MAAFGIGTNTNIKNVSVVTTMEKQVEVACDCWFSRKGKTIPQLIKYEDENSEIHTVSSIKVISTEDKLYCGIKTREFLCRAVAENIQYEFKLILRKEECKWYLLK